MFILGLELENRMLITRMPLEVLIANDPQHHYLPSSSSFLGVLQQDVDARIRELEDWETLRTVGRGDHTFRHNAVVLDEHMAYPIIERKMNGLMADVGVLEHAREIRIYCHLYFVDMFEQEKIKGFYCRATPLVSLYTVTPLLKSRKQERVYAKSA